MKLNIKRSLPSVANASTPDLLWMCFFLCKAGELANSFGASALPVTLIKDFLLI